MFHRTDVSFVTVRHQISENRLNLWRKGSVSVGWKTRSRKGTLVVEGTEMVILGSAESSRKTQRPTAPAVLNSIAN